MTRLSGKIGVKAGVLACTANAVLLAGCGAAQEQQSALNPVGSRAQAIDAHWQTMLWVGAAVWVIVVAMTLATLVRRRHRGGPSDRPAADSAADQPASAEDETASTEDGPADGEDGLSDDEGDPEDDEVPVNDARTDRRAVRFVAVGGAILPALIILAIAVQSVWVLEQDDPGQDVEGRTISVTGHQYWWEVEYPEHGVVTANEIHIPTGERVQLELNSTDVVHSVWVPELSGKTDMIPGRATSMWLETDEPGTYWGQCAEYCGMQHALMRFVVVAHDPDEFDGWIEAQGQTAAEPPVAPPNPLDEPGQDSSAESTADGEQPPRTPEQQEDELVAQGREVFMSSSCVYCHTVAGTEAQGQAGPDLTHLASRQTLAAGTLPNTPGNLAAWVVDPQAIKPGNEMPGTDVEGDELQALLAYLESLE